MPSGQIAPRPTLSARIQAEFVAEARQIILVTGAPGSGKTFLISEALSGLSGVHFCAAGLEDSQHQSLFAGQLDRQAPESAAFAAQRPGWAALLERAFGDPDRFLVLDGIGSLVRSNKQFLAILGTAWRNALRQESAPLVILVDRDRTVLDRVNAKGSTFRDPMERATAATDPGVWLEVAPLPYPAWSRWTSPEPLELLRLAGAFGGRPAVMRHVDGAGSLALNYQRLVLDPDGPLWDEPLLGWSGDLKHAGRYGALCTALAEGARQWADLADYLGKDASTSSVGPYMKRLVSLGRVRPESSLDARRGGRGQRYALSDPFDALWWSAVLPLRSELESRVESPASAWQTIAKEILPEHMGRMLPTLCRQFLQTSSQPVLGATARHAGSLWGDGYDIPVAAILQNGAVVYGACHVGPEVMTDVALDRLESHVRATRFGFGREARIRALFSLSGFSEALALRASRDPLVRLIGPSEMVQHKGEMT